MLQASYLAKSIIVLYIYRERKGKSGCRAWTLQSIFFVVRETCVLLCARFVARAGKRTSQADDVVGSALTVCLAGSKRGRGRIDVAAINVSLSRARP